jgi:GT2 family glycosyltransferase
VATQGPSVSLIVLNWNGRKHLAACLESLLGLEYPADRLEVVLCDNGSADGSVDYVREGFPAVRVVALDQNLGFAEGNNRAAVTCTSEWIGFLNNDMKVEAPWLKNLVSLLDEHPSAACIGSRIKNWDGSRIDFVGGGVNYQGHGFQLDHGAKKSERDRERRVLFACGGAMLIRRELFQAVDGFDSDFFAYFEDVDLGWRLNLLGHDVWYTPRATAFHRHHATADRLEPHRLRSLYERNALFTIYKCFEDKTLAEALPAALLLLNERGLRLAEVDAEEFRLGPPPGGEVAQQGPSASAQRLYAYDPAEVFTESLAARARRVLREQGLGTAVYKTGRFLRWRTRSFFVHRLLNILGQVQPEAFLMPGVAVSHYAAASQFAHSLDRVRAKRDWLSERRKRSDEELVPLFEDPFFANYSDPRYLAFYKWLTQVVGLDRRLGPARD